MDQSLSKKISLVSLVAIVFVVLLHAWNLRVRYAAGTALDLHPSFNVFLQTFLSDGVARVSVPLFFSISGFLFFYKFVPSRAAFADKFRRRLRSLLLPYLLWSLYGLALFYLLQSIPFSRPYFASELISHYSASQLLLRWLWNPIPYQLWFLRDLMALILLSPLIYFLIRRLAYLPVLMALAWWFWRSDVGFLNSDSVLYFLLGATLAVKEVPIRVAAYPLRRLALSVWLALVFIRSLLFMYMPHSALLGILQSMGVLIGVYATWASVDPRAAWTARLLPLSAYTFFIYAFHEPVLTLYKKLLLKALGDTAFSELMVYLLAPILSVVSALIAAVFLQRYLPSLYDLLTGGRSGRKTSTLPASQALEPNPEKPLSLDGDKPANARAPH